MKIVYAAILGALMAVPAQAAEKTVKTNYLACNPERQFNRADRILKSGDEAALKAYTAGALLSGSCIWLKEGTSVFTAGVGKGEGVVKIRPKGSVVTYFTSDTIFQ
jgi:hypothetical protein